VTFGLLMQDYRTYPARRHGRILLPRPLYVVLLMGWVGMPPMQLPGSTSEPPPERKEPRCE
jgi:hypothetical protein